MNTRTFDWINAVEEEIVRLDAQGMVDDEQLGVPATYIIQGEPTFDPGTGEVTSNNTEIPLRVLRGSIGAAEIRASGGLYQQGDVKFTIPQAAIVGPPGREHRLLVDGETFEFIQWAGDPLEAIWNIIGRRVK